MISPLSSAIAIMASLAFTEAYDAVIVGAGWAGLRALATLLDQGIDDVLLLEANNRVGGRCWSVNADGTSNNPNLGRNVIPYDLGADLNYDSVINFQQEVLYDDGLMPDALWENDYHVDWPHWAGWTNFYQEKEVNGRYVTKPITDGLGRGFDGDGMLNFIWGTFTTWRAENLDWLEGKSFGEALDIYIEQDQWTDDEALDFLDLIHDASHLQFGTGGYDLDISEAMEDSAFHEASNYVGIPGAGWGNIAAAYAEQFKDKIRLNSRVYEIDQTDDYYATVKYTDANGNAWEVEALTVLVTASLGVLKAGNINFIPQLPADKRRAIYNMGFGVNNKCVMSWNDRGAAVWPQERTWILLATEDKETSGGWTTFSNPTKYKGVPALTGWIGGEDAKAMEDQSDEEIMDDVMRSLKKMFPDITRPDNYYISRWGQEPDVLGVYTFPATGKDHYGDMWTVKQRDGVVYFAGEHLINNGWSTVFGAWDSGEEVAWEMAERIPKLRQAARAAGAKAATDNFVPGKVENAKEELDLETDASRDDGGPATEVADLVIPEVEEDVKDVPSPEAEEARDEESPAADVADVMSPEADDGSKEDEVMEVDVGQGAADAAPADVAPAGSPAETHRSPAWRFAIGYIVAGLIASSR